jgi:hypothetical protein
VYATSTTGQAIYAESTGTGGSAINGTAANGIGGYFFNNSTGFATLIVSNFGSGNLAQFSNSAGTKFTINNAGNLGNGTYTYTLPSATGTLALTSALSSYLPLTGGTLTGSAIWNTAGIAIDLQNTSYLRFSNSGGATRWGYIQHDGTDLAFANDIGAGKFTFNKPLSGTSATFSGVVTSSVASGTGTFKINNRCNLKNKRIYEI